MSDKFSKDAIIRHVQKQLRIYNQNYNIIFTGMCGSGKSYGALEFCKLVDKSFNIDRIAFSEEEFMELIQKEMPKGSAILWDEAGVGLDSREFMSVINKVLSYVAMTMRSRNQLVVFTTPSMNYVDKKAREMLHAYVEMLGANPMTKQSAGKFFALQTNYRYGKTYFKSPVVLKQNMPFVINPVYFNLPDKKLTDEYEKKKIAYTRELYADALNKIKEAKGLKPKKKTRTTNKEYIQEIKDNIDKFKVGDKVSMDKVALEYNFGRDKKRLIKSMLKTEGVRV